MPRVGTGSVIPKTLTDGTCAYELRFHARGRRESITLHERAPCQCGCGGGWDERSARRELGNIVARVRAGVWTREAAHPRVAAQASAATRRIPTFHEYASYWLHARTDGVLGDKPIEENTRRDYLWRLRGHLLPFFAPRRLDEIDPELCLAFKAHKVREAADLRTAPPERTSAIIAGGKSSRSDRRRSAS